MIKACIFDLDGVIVDTAKYHFIAWKWLAGELGFELSEADNEKLKGVSRMGSLEQILQWAGIDLDEHKKLELAGRKNDCYRKFIAKMKPKDVLPGVMSFLGELRQKGIAVALGSASKNAAYIIERVGLSETFQVIIDGTKTAKSKPDPEVFILGAAALGFSPEECIVFEDAAVGIDAALNGGFYAVGIGESSNLGHAHMVIPGFSNVCFQDFINERP